VMACSKHFLDAAVSRGFGIQDQVYAAHTS
jgi:hypothetical protein